MSELFGHPKDIDPEYEAFRADQHQIPEVETTVLAEKALMVREETVAIRPVGISPFDLEPAEFQAGLDRRKANRAALLRWIGEALIEGTDFGKIHMKKRSECPKGAWCKDPSHFSKPVLFKPGSEKIGSMLGLTATYRPLSHDERATIGGVPETCIVVKCELVSGSGVVVAEGLGARTPEYGDVNKALKMAEKSARINATLQLGLSDSYTQDLDDMAGEDNGGSGAAHGESGRQAASPAPSPVGEDLSPKLKESVEQAQARKAQQENLYDYVKRDGDDVLCACGSQVIRRRNTKGAMTHTCLDYFEASYGKVKDKIEATARFLNRGMDDWEERKHTFKAVKEGE